MKKIFTFLFSFSASVSFAQVVPVEWTRDYNGPADNDDQAVDLFVDGAGNAYVTGTSFALNGTYDIATIKYNAAGTIQWTASFNGSGNDNDAASAITVDASGNVYVTGRAKSTSNLEDIVTIKYNSAGIQQWAMTYNGSGNGIDEGRDVVVDANGNVFVTGYITQSSTFTDAVTIMYTPAGLEQWATPFNGTGSGNDQGAAIVHDGIGNVYVCGKGNETTSSTLSDVVTIKYNASNGSQVWVRSYDGGNDNDYGKAIAMDPAGNVISTGMSYLNGNWFDYATIKYDAAGTQQWSQRYNFGSQKYEEPTAIITDVNNNVYVTGMSQGPGNQNAQNDIATIKYNAAGTQQWAARYTSSGDFDDRGFGIGIDDTLNVYVNGYMSLSQLNRDYITVKYDAGGTQKWTVAYNGAGNGLDEGHALGVGPGSEIYVTGFSDVASGTNTNNNFTTIKYATANIGFAEFGGSYSEIIIYPNPSSGNSTISITSKFIQDNTDLFLSVYDVTGREIAAAEKFRSYNAFATYDLGKLGLKPGAYTITVRDANGSFRGAGKLIIQ